MFTKKLFPFIALTVLVIASLACSFGYNPQTGFTFQSGGSAAAQVAIATDAPVTAATMIPSVEWTSAMMLPQIVIEKCAGPNVINYEDYQSHMYYDCAEVRTFVAASLTPTQPAQPQTTFCGQARDLGPWAPTSDGIGETFEVTSTLDDSTGIVLGLWFPDGNTPWGQKEITTFIEPGLSIEVQNGAGRGFDYPVGCSTSEVDSQLADHMVQRKLDTKYNGFVDVDELIRLGLVKVRFDRRDQ